MKCFIVECVNAIVSHFWSLNVFFKLRLIDTDLRKCADFFLHKISPLFCSLKLQLWIFGNTGCAAVYETSDVISLPF